RTRLLDSRLAGRRHPLGARRGHPPAPAGLGPMTGARDTPLLREAGKVARSAGRGVESRDASMKVCGDARAIRLTVEAAGHTLSGAPDQVRGSRRLPQHSWGRKATG